MLVRLTVKLAAVMEGVDVSAHSEGNVIELAQRDAVLLIRGGWAEPVVDERRVTYAPLCRGVVAAARRRKAD